MLPISIERYLDYDRTSLYPVCAPQGVLLPVLLSEHCRDPICVFGNKLSRILVHDNAFIMIDTFLFTLDFLRNEYVVHVAPTGASTRCHHCVLVQSGCSMAAAQRTRTGIYCGQSFFLLGMCFHASGEPQCLSWGK